MYHNIFDTHAHYAAKPFNSDREALLAQLPADGIRYVMLAGCHVDDSAACVALAEQYDYMYCSVGVHPTRLKTLQKGWQDRLAKLAQHEKVLAIGECGLDYHIPEIDRDLQKEIFIDQLSLAESLDLPMIFHIREATGDGLEMLKRYRPKGVVHCFGGSAETARELTDLGLYLGIGGSLTFSNARRVLEAVKTMPLDKMVFETDCPFLTPEPFRRERNDSRRIALVAEMAAQLRGMDVQELIDICCENGKRLFGIE